MLEAERVTITQDQINKSVELAELASRQQREYDIALTKYQEKQKVYQRVIDCQRELRLAEQEVRDMEEQENRPVEQPVKPKRKEMILRQGSWVEID